MTKENWLPIPDFPDYAVSDCGRVKRIRSVPKTRHRKETVKVPHPTRDGYFDVALYKNGKPYYLRIHRLVLHAFVGRPPTGKPQTNHINGNKQDNRLENLEWVSASENRLHAINVLGREKVRGEQHGRSTLREFQVREIKRQLADGLGQGIIAKQFGVSQSAISDIKRGKLWKHIV